MLQKRSYPPGQHGQSRSRPSEFGLQLREKQKAKINYGLQERQFIRVFQKALKQQGITGDNLLKLLEMRLDNVIYRLGFAETRAQARQLVNHGFFEVNGKKVGIASYTIKPGEKIAVRASKQKSKYMQGMKEKLAHAKVLDWLELTTKEFAGKVLAVPTPEQIDNQINTQLIVEHYSRI